MPSKLYPVKCKMCGEDKLAYPNTRDNNKPPEYCSNKCRNKAKRTLSRGAICETCGKEFEYTFDKYFCRRGNLKFCSPSCKMAGSVMALLEKRKKSCTTCGVVMYPSINKVGVVGSFLGKTRFCSDACRRKYKSSLGMGRSRKNDGYTTRSKSCLHGRELELANAMVAGDSILEHRLVMAVDLDRPLGKKEVVHHINGNPSDNRISNLMLQSWNMHSLSHKENNRLVMKLKKRIADLEAEVDSLRQMKIQVA